MSEAFITLHQVKLTKISLSLKLSFPSITSKLLAINIETTKSLIPVAEKNEASNRRNAFSWLVRVKNMLRKK